MYITDHKTMSPMGNRVLVRPLEDQKETSDGGIFLPDAARPKGQVAEVIGVGPGCETQVKKGDVVIITPFRGHEISLGGVIHELLREEDIFGVLA